MKKEFSLQNFKQEFLSNCVPLLPQYVKHFPHRANTDKRICFEVKPTPQ